MTTTTITRPSLGRIVLLTFEAYSGAVVERPGVVVNAWGSALINVRPILDGANDGSLKHPGAGGFLGDLATKLNALTLTSVGYDSQAQKPGTWRYPPAVKDTIDVTDPVYADTPAAPTP